MTKLYTREQLIKKYGGKFIDTYKHFNYQEQKAYYEVRGVKSKIWENHNSPEDLKD